MSERRSKRVRARQQKLSGSAQTIIDLEELETLSAENNSRRRKLLTRIAKNNPTRCSVCGVPGAHSLREYVCTNSKDIFLNYRCWTPEQSARTKRLEAILEKSWALSNTAVVSIDAYAVAVATSSNANLSECTAQIGRAHV
jgi:hypothetical protein